MTTIKRKKSIKTARKYPNFLSHYAEKRLFSLHNLPFHLKQQVKLNLLVTECVKDLVNATINVSKYDKGILDVSVSTQTELNHLIYLKPKLQEALVDYTEFANLQEIRFFIQPMQHNVRHTLVHPSKKPEQPVIDNIELIAKSSIQNEQLKQQLLELSKKLNSIS